MTELRRRLTQLRTKAINRVQHILMRHNLQQECPTKGIQTIKAKKWLSELELEFFVSDYSQSGFTGGLNWYRSFDLKWAQRRPFEGVTSSVPAYFLGSEHDVDLEGFHGEDPIGQMRQIFPELRQVRMIPGAGHMVQLEASGEVNAALLDFLADISRHG